MVHHSAISTCVFPALIGTNPFSGASRLFLWDATPRNESGKRSGPFVTALCVKACSATSRSFLLRGKCGRARPSVGLDSAGPIGRNQRSPFVPSWTRTVPSYRLRAPSLADGQFDDHCFCEEQRVILT